MLFGSVPLATWVLQRIQTFEDVETVQPGTWMRIDLSMKETTHVYFDLAETYGYSNEFDETEITELLIETVVRHTRCKFDYSIQLSGSLDGSLATAIAANAIPGLGTFGVSQGAPTINEGRYQAYLAKRFETCHTNVHITRGDVLGGRC